METLKKQFVAPTLTVEASLEDVTLISGGGGKKHGHGHNNHHDNHHNNHHNDHGHRDH